MHADVTAVVVSIQSPDTIAIMIQYRPVLHDYSQASPIVITEACLRQCCSSPVISRTKHDLTEHQVSNGDDEESAEQS